MKYTYSWKFDLKDIEGEDVDWIYLTQNVDLLLIRLRKLQGL